MIKAHRTQCWNQSWHFYEWSKWRYSHWNIFQLQTLINYWPDLFCWLFHLSTAEDLIGGNCNIEHNSNLKGKLTGDAVGRDKEKSHTFWLSDQIVGRRWRCGLDDNKEGITIFFFSPNSNLLIIVNLKRTCDVICNKA